ncbi:MAG TPA: lysophospholipid acyltransferase family protein [Gemmatimonadaceae bacterium]|nr:lysophospholipid acyltransferase family protein [Gemmatimonadaceae bacterium]
MTDLLDRLINAWLWVATVLVVLLGLPAVTLVFLVTAPFDPGRYYAGRAFRLIAVVHTAVNPYWHFRLSGQVHLADPRRPYVVVSNHESYADVFLISHLPWEMKWLAKRTIFKIPVMGWMMRMAGDVPVDRGSRRSAVVALARCRDRLRKRVSVMIFPEGTRSRDGGLLPFRDGAFRLAVETQLPVLPLVVAGTRDMMAKGTFRFRPAHADVRVLDAVPTAGLREEDVPALRERVRAIIDAARRELARERGEPEPPRLAADLAPHPEPSAAVESATPLPG